MIQHSERDDRMLQLAVAGFVALGIVGLALLASCSADERSRQAKATETAPAVVTHVEPAIDRTASYVPTAPALETLDAVELDESTVIADAPFTVEAGADTMKRGHETYAAGEYDKAVAYFAAEVDARPGGSWGQYMYGLASWKHGELEQAGVALSRAAELNPESIKARINLSRVQNERGEFEAALEAARQALTLDPENPEALFLEGRSLQNLGRFDESLASLQRSVEIDTDNAYVHNMIGWVLLRSGRESEAVLPLETAASLKPEVAFIQNNLGMALERSGRVEDAVAAYRRAVDTDETHARAAANLARLSPNIADLPVAGGESRIVRQEQPDETEGGGL